MVGGTCSGDEKGCVDALGSAGKGAPLLGDTPCVPGCGLGAGKGTHTQCTWHPCSWLLQRAKNPGPSTSVSSWEGNVAKEMSPTSLGLRAFSSLFSKIYIPRSPTSVNISETPQECSLLSVHSCFFSASYYTVAPLPKAGAQTFVN